MPDSEYEDSNEIGDNELLWRVIPPEHLRNNYVPPQAPLSEAAFRTEELSVYRASMRSLAEILALWPDGSRVRQFTAGFARHENNCILILDPQDSSHVLIRRKDNPTKRLTGGQANAFIRASEFV